MTNYNTNNIFTIASEIYTQAEIEILNSLNIEEFNYEDYNSSENLETYDNIRDDIKTLATQKSLSFLAEELKNKDLDYRDFKDLRDCLSLTTHDTNELENEYFE